MLNVTRGFLLLFLLSLSTAIYAQSTPIQSTQTPANLTQKTEARLLGTTQALRDMDLKPVVTTGGSKSKKKLFKRSSMPNFVDNSMMPTPFAATAKPKYGDPLVNANAQLTMTLDVEPQLVFEGMGFSDSGITPPDTNGDVSPEHYIQSINNSSGSVFKIWDKEGNIMLETTAANAFWEEFGITGLGDPVVLWDHSAERWLISELGTFGSNVMLVAVSVTSDPMGEWNAYEFQAPGLPDYPKYAIWHNAYFVTTNEFTDEFIPVYALDREAMLNGEATADALRMGGMTKFADDGGAFQVATPAHWEGPTPPPAGSPGYAVRIYDDAWEGGEDRLEVWEMDVDFTGAATGTVNGPTMIPISAFESELCEGSIFDCLPMPNGSTLSALQQVIMYRVQYRNFGSHESMVLNFSVAADVNDIAGIRWVELRKQAAGDWGLWQEGTLGGDETNRFMGSVALDGGGNMLMGYHCFDDELGLSLRYTGRLAGDPLGELTINEYQFADGLNWYTQGRWGDYSSMSIDPVDDRTFWYTGEYMGEDDWKTKIVSVFLRRDTFDVGVPAMAAPVNSGNLTNAEEVTVSVRNFGYEPASNFDIAISMNGSAPITENITTTLAPDEIIEHTFTPTFDMSAIGPYEFTIYTSWVQDTAFFNDTLRTVVYQLTRNDAAVIGVEGTDIPICAAEFSGGIVLKNEGVDPLTAATVEWQVNAGPVQTINWTGNLAPGETEILPITYADIIDGENTISVTVSQPNGVPDEDPTDNTIERTFEMVLSGGAFTLVLQTDDYANETSWQLENAMGTIVEEGGTYTGFNNTLLEIPLCLGEGCYTIRFFDAWGDGICCGYGDGYYQIVRDSDGEVLVFNPNFNGSEASNDFCTDADGCTIEAEFGVQNVSEAGATDGSIFVDPQNGTAPYEYSIDGGTTWQASAMFSNLPAGEYTVLVQDAQLCGTQIEVEVGTCTLMASAEVTPAATSNSNDGIITVNADNGNAPFQYSINGVNYIDNPVFADLGVGNYTVYIQDAAGCVQEVEVSVSSVVAVTTPYFGLSVKVLPNPTDGIFELQVKGAEDLSTLRLDIIDATGRLLRQDRLVAYDGILRNEISLVPYPNGIYFIRLQDTRFSQMLRVLKQ